jgi:acetyl-CoA carboxylase biotin carboxyl carrier protein
MSGIFYRTPAPDAPSFVEEGAAVIKGQTLALLEAMKVFSKVKAPVSGTIAEIRGVHQGTVTVGEVLFRIARG